MIPSHRPRYYSSYQMSNAMTLEQNGIQPLNNVDGEMEENWAISKEVRVQTVKNPRRNNMFLFRRKLTSYIFLQEHQCEHGEIMLSQSLYNTR